MALVQESSVKVTGSLGSETIQMGIAVNSLPHLMKMMSNIYSDVVMAVIREYCTNAIDSHMASGQTKPIEVTSPSRLNPNFVVKDYGLGMSLQDIREIYAMYGESTKRKSENQTGQIGIGAKVGLAYTNQFTLESNKDGRKVIAVIGYNEQGSGEIQIVMDAETTDPNGVTITVPVNNDIRDFDEKLRTFHKYVDPGLMLLDGKPYIQDPDRFHLTDNIIIQPRSLWRTPDMLVMGNVAYPLNGYGTTQMFDSDLQVIFKVPMSSVSFPPTREELQYDNRTKQKIDEIRDELKLAVWDYVEKDVAAASDHEKARIRYVANLKKFHGRCAELLSSDDMKYKGIVLPRDNRIDLCNTVYRWENEDDNIRVTSGTESARLVLNANSWYPSVPKVIIQNYLPTKMTKVQARKIVKYIEEEKLDNFESAYFITGEVSDEHKIWLSGWKILDWNVIKESKHDPIVTGPRADKRKWEGGGGGVNWGHHYPDTSKNIYYGSREQVRSGRYFYEKDVAGLMDSNSQFFLVTPSEKDLFLKRYPKAVHYSKVAEQRVIDAIAKITAEDRLVIVNDSMCLFLTEFNSSYTFDDPILKELHEASKHYSDSREKVNRIRNMINKIPNIDRTKYQQKLPIRQSNCADPFERRYPLLRMFRSAYTYKWDSSVRDDIVKYMNDTYKNNKKKKV